VTIIKVVVNISGWKWTEEDWQVDLADGPCALFAAGVDQGWLYCSDFSSFSSATSGQARKGMTHFVRRRRLVRTMVFDGKRDY
jgi:hypothetical protein